jgi:hypothetical protein
MRRRVVLDRELAWRGRGRWVVHVCKRTVGEFEEAVAKELGVERVLAASVVVPLELERGERLFLVVILAHRLVHLAHDPCVRGSHGGRRSLMA